MTDRPLFSIITVCYQAEAVIEKTLKSVREQTFADYEMIIVDGASTDNTTGIIGPYLDDPRVRMISEKDDGLYYAMNKGAALANGRYLNFLNAGDIYSSNNVLEDVASFIRANRADMYYGDIVYDNPDGTKNVRKYSQFCSSDFYYLLGDCINHQSLFAARECFEADPFDTSFVVGCYRDWLIRKKKEKRSFRYMPYIICEYSLDPDSFSIKNSRLLWSEVDICIKKYYPWGYPLYSFLNLIRRGRLSSKILHSLYKLILIRKR